MKNKSKNTIAIENRVHGLKLINFEYVNKIDDSVSHILKAHLIIENLIERLLLFYLGKKGDPILALNLSFSKKLDLIIGYKLIPVDISNSIRKLNTLRNKCVHNLGIVIKHQNIEDIINEIKDKMPYGDKNKDIKILLLRYLGWIMGYLAPKTWEK